VTPGRSDGQDGVTAAAHSTEPVIAVAGLAKRYGDRTAVHDVSFEVAQGEIFGLLGPNGAGKTTTVECVQGLRTHDAGTVRVLGLDPHTQAAALRTQIGAQLQESALPARIRVAEALDLFSSLQPGGPPWQQTMQDWGLAGKARASFSSLSGGQRQRLLVALAVVNGPRLVFLDEMTTGLDPAARRDTWDLIERIRDQGATVVLVTHFMDEAERLCDRVAVIRDGRVVATGSPAQLVAQHDDEVTITFTVNGTLPPLDRVPGVASVHLHGPSVVVRGKSVIVARVGRALSESGIEPPDIMVARPSLEDVYLRLVGRGE
jgi:ABC-2 type transport system ATP-binding protein